MSAAARRGSLRGPAAARDFLGRVLLTRSPGLDSGAAGIRVVKAMGAPGVFFLVAGPSGAGKTSVLRRLLESSAELEKDISVTTRAPRPGEADGRDYRFWTVERFQAALARGEFLEHAVVHGKDYYGTLRGPVLERLNGGWDAIKDMDVQGVEQIRRTLPYPRSVAVFMVPPSREALLERLRGRGTEDPATLARRLESAERELVRTAEFDYLVLNGKLDDAVEDLKAIRRAERCRGSRGEGAFRARWPGGK